MTSSKRHNTTYCPESRTWHGVVYETTHGSQDTIGAVVLKSMMDKPESIAQICYQSGKEFTNLEMANHLVQVATFFDKRQLQQGEIIGMCVSNTDYTAPVFFGALTAGLVVSTLDPSFDKSGIKHIYGMSRPKIMFCDGNIYHTVRVAFEECGLSETPIYTMNKHIVGVPSVMELFDDTVEIGNFRARILEKGAEQAAVIVCTSGTTGPPKGVFISHGALLEYTNFNATVGFRMLCFSTIHWLSGIVVLIRGKRGGYTRIISEKPYSADDFLNIVERYKINYISSTPAQIALALISDKLATTDLSSVLLHFCGGSAVPYSLIEKFKHFTPNARFVVIYTMSELACPVSYGECEPSNSVGKLYANMEAKIVDDEGHHLGPSEVGEICMRSRFPWPGYLNNPEATNAIYDDDCWIHSGDLGYINDEGRLYVVDRKKDIMKYNNFHISPTEIEIVISSLPQVADVCVIGIPDEIYAFLPAAAVIKRPGSTIDESEICQYVAERMQHFEQLRGGVYFFDQLPQTVTGKIFRRKVTELCCQRRKIAEDQSNQKG